MDNLGQDPPENVVEEAEEDVPPTENVSNKNDKKIADENEVHINIGYVPDSARPQKRSKPDPNVEFTVGLSSRRRCRVILTVLICLVLAAIIGVLVYFFVIKSDDDDSSGQPQTKKSGTNCNFFSFG